MRLITFVFLFVITTLTAVFVASDPNILTLLNALAPVRFVMSVATKIGVEFGISLQATLLIGWVVAMFAVIGIVADLCSDLAIVKERCQRQKTDNKSLNQNNTDLLSTIGVLQEKIAELGLKRTNLMPKTNRVDERLGYLALELSKTEGMIDLLEEQAESQYDDEKGEDGDAEADQPFDSSWKNQAAALNGKVQRLKGDLIGLIRNIEIKISLSEIRRAVDQTHALVIEVNNRSAEALVEEADEDQDVDQQN